MKRKIVWLHIYKLAFYPLESSICLLIHLGVDGLDEGTGILVEGVST